MLDQIKKHIQNNIYRIVFIGDSLTSCEWVHPNQLGNAYIAKVFLEKVFGISFDPEKYIKETAEGRMYPAY